MLVKKNWIIYFLLIYGFAVILSFADEPIELPISQQQIFVDDSLIAYTKNVVRKTHPCEKLAEPVLKVEKSWEGNRVYIYGTVLHDEKSGLFRIWYANNETHVLYATSQDGLHWQRPDLGITEYNGSTENNIVYGMESPSVIFDPQESDPAQQYKILGCIKKPVRGYFVAHSPDGLHWTAYPKNPVLKGSDTCTLARDPNTGEYLAFHKLKNVIRGHRRRLVYLSVSKDMQTWAEPELVLEPDEIDDQQTRTEGGQFSQFYNMSAFPYAGQWLGLITHFRFSGPPKQSGPEQSKDDGPIDVQLVHSRDGRNWHRCSSRSPVIPNGPYAYDAGCILGTANMPVIVGDEMWIYYTAITTTHGGFMPDKQITIARASWRLDGMVSLYADSNGGFVETVTIRPDGEQLVVNAAASDGELSVEVLDAEGHVIPGYSRDDCQLFCGDGVRQRILWKDHDRLPTGQFLRLKFYLTHANLYSYTFQ